MGKISIDVDKKTDESLVIHAFSTSTEKKWQYSVNNGGWKDAETENSSTATIVIKDLEPHTTYTIGVRTNILNEKYIDATTLYPLTISSASDVYWDDENASITFKANIPTGIDSGYGDFADGGNAEINFNRINTTLFTINTTIQNGENTISFSGEQRNKFLEILSNSKELVFNFDIEYFKKRLRYKTGHLTFHGKTTAEKSAPILTDFVYRDNDPEAVSVTGNNQLLITNESNLIVNITPAEPRNYAEISAYTVTVGNVSVSTVDTRVSVGRIGLSGVVPIVVTAIDSRGYTATMTKIVNYIPYTPIELTELSIERINNVEKMTRFSLNGSITPIMIDRVDKNPLKAILYQIRPTNEESFGELIEIPKDSVVFDENGFSLDIPQWIEFDEKLSYYIRIVVQDQLTQDDETIPLANGRPVLSLRKEKVGINNNNPQHALDIDGDLNLTGRILINGEEIDLGGIN